MSKLGLSRTREKILVLIIKQKFVHILVVLLTFFVVFTNMADKTKAESANDQVSGTIMASLVADEFADDLEAPVPEEYTEEQGSAVITPPSYMDVAAFLEPISNPDDSELLIDKESYLSFEGEALEKPDVALTDDEETVVQQRTETIVYVVNSGDSVSTIAQKFGISVNTVLWANNLSAFSMIRPGQELEILPMSGVSHKVEKGENLGYIAKKYDVDGAKILEANNLADASLLKIGQNLVIPGGSKIKPVVVARTNTVTGITAIKNLVKPGDASPVASNKMNWPTVGARISQYYSWRHSAVDIANKVGTPIYAADAGTVIFAGWSNGYGNRMDIDHGGGKITRYAHLSQFYVEKGDVVSKGGTIAAMGNTGWSTGPHLHFEVIIGGKKLNPLNYIK